MGYILHDNTKNSIEIYKDRRIARKSSPIEPAQDREGGSNSIPCKNNVDWIRLVEIICMKYLL